YMLDIAKQFFQPPLQGIWIAIIGTSADRSVRIFIGIQKHPFLSGIFIPGRGIGFYGFNVRPYYGLKVKFLLHPYMVSFFHWQYTSSAPILLLSGPQDVLPLPLFLLLGQY